MSEARASTDDAESRLPVLEAAFPEAAVLGRALRDEAAILLGAVPALLALLLCWAFGAALASGVEAALWTTVASLIAFELLAGIRARATPRELALEAGVGVTMGLAIIALKVVLH